MKVTENTPDLLIIDDQPWFFAVALGGTSLMFASAAVSGLFSGDLEKLWFLMAQPVIGILAYFFVRRTQLVMHAPGRYAEIRRRTLLGYSYNRYELHDIERAIVETMKDSDGATHRPTLVIPTGHDTGRHPVTMVYTSGNGARNAVASINAWLDSLRLQG